MKNLQVINHPQFGMLSIVIIDGKEMFKAKECAVMLGYSNPEKAIRDHCKGVNETFTPTKGGNQKTKIIPEADLWRLIIRSKLPQAEQVEHWIMEEVLPSIRKTGTYKLEYEQLKLEEKPYEYFDKHYIGFPVMTLADIEHFTKIPKRSIQYFLDTKTTKGLDYLVIGKSDLAKFKMDNLKINMSMSHLTIVFKSGFDILTKIARLTADVECFKAIEAPAKIEKSPKWLYVDIDNSKVLKEQIKKARKHIDTFDTILSKLETKSMEEGKFKSITQTVNALALELSLELMYINSKEYVTTAEYIEG